MIFFFFISSSSSLLLSFLRFSLLFSSPLSLFLSCLSSYMSPSPLFLSPSPRSLLLSPSPLFFFFFFFSLSSSLFSLCLLSLSSLVVYVSSCVCRRVCLCVWCGVVCRVVRHAENPVCRLKNASVCRFKRPRVCRQHAHMLFSMCAWCRYTRGRFECTHGERFFEATHGGRRQFCLPRTAHVEFSLGPREVHQKNF